MKRLLIRVAATILRPVIAQIVRDEVKELVALKLLVDEGYKKAFKLRVRKHDAHSQCVRFAGLAAHDGVVLPFLQLAEHLCLELVPVDSAAASGREERLEEDSHHGGDQGHASVVDHVSHATTGTA